MQKILIFIDWFLPGYKAGGPVSSVSNLVDHLHDHYQFYIVTRNIDYLETTPYKDIEPDIWQKKYKANIMYLSQNNISSATISKIIKEVNPAIVYVNGIYSWKFSILPLLNAKKLKKKVVVAARGMLSVHAFSSKSIKKKFFLKTVDFTGLYKNVTLQATTTHEQEEIKQLLGKKVKTLVIPNLPKLVKLEKGKRVVKNKGELRLVSIARISIEKNTRFIFEVLNHVFDGKITMDLFGGIYNQQYWEQCLEIAKSFPGNIKTEHKGTMEPTLVSQTFQKYHIAFMPSLGENFGHGHFESMMSGIPLITSDTTPWRNMESLKKMSDTDYLKETAGWDIDLKKVDKFRDVIKYCLRLEQEEYEIISSNAMKYASRAINVGNIKAQYINLFGNDVEAC